MGTSHGGVNFGRRLPPMGGQYSTPINTCGSAGSTSERSAHPTASCAHTCRAVPESSRRADGSGTAQALHRTMPGRQRIARRQAPSYSEAAPATGPAGIWTARALPSPVQTEPETTDAAPRGEAVYASRGPIGVPRTVWTAAGQAALSHPLTTLADLAPTAPPLPQQKSDSQDEKIRCRRRAAHIDPAPREIRQRNNPTETPEDLTS